VRTSEPFWFGRTGTQRTIVVNQPMSAISPRITANNNNFNGYSSASTNSLNGFKSISNHRNFYEPFHF
jgi:hypothetical protein